jgi:hypothetical protein
MGVNILTLRRMLRRVHLGGIIGECVLEEGKSGMNNVRAIDLTNSLILAVSAKTGFTDFGQLGIGDLSTLCKYLDTAEEDTEIEVSENRLLLKNKSGKFKYLLSQPDLIPTAMEDKEATDTLVATCTHDVEVTEDVQKSFLANIGLTKTNSVEIYMDGKNVILRGGLESEHKFSIKMGNVNVLKDSDRKYKIPIFGSHLGAVLSVLDWSNNENLPKLLLKSGRPVIVKQQKDVWALTIVKSDEEK